MIRLFDFLNIHTLILLCLLLPATMTFLGCDSSDGPAEKTGEKIDEAAEEVSDEIDDATKD